MTAAAAPAPPASQGASQTSFVALLRGINVGGNNLIRMPALKAAFEDAGYGNVRTYIQSGNVLFRTGQTGPQELEQSIERMLEERFGIPILVVARSRDELADIVASAPEGHGSPLHRSDVFFLKHPLSAEEALAQFPDLRDGVDAVAPGPGVVYFSRLDAEAGRSRITRIMGTPLYRRITIRNWRTTTKLLQLIDE